MTSPRRSSLKTQTTESESRFARLIPHQHIKIVPSFVLESGVELYNVPVAFSTRGKLSPQGDNAMVICHALSGSADVSDWWGPLLGGPGKAFDVTRFFVICINSLGSPYGTASPVTYKDGDPAQETYGPEFPLTTIRDDVRLSKVLLDSLGVKQIAAAIGGSMGGMLVLEFAYFGKDYVKCIVPIATSPRHSAWCISWGEAQRQSIYSDPKYEDGYYDPDDPPATGLGAARMSALLTYRSRNSFESRFGRNVQAVGRQSINNTDIPVTAATRAFAIHNDGHRHVGRPRKGSNNHSRSVSRDQSNHRNTTEPEPSKPTDYFTNATNHNDTTVSPSAPPRDSTTTNNTSNNTLPTPSPNGPITVPITDPEFHGTTTSPTTINPPTRRTNPKSSSSNFFSAQSYLRYQGDKFIKRFDANCYIAITRKLDTHDLSFHCQSLPSNPEDAVRQALALIQQPCLVLGIESDGLFTFEEQKEIARGIPGARLERIESPEGHDAFLLQFEQVNRFVVGFLEEALPEIMSRVPVDVDGEGTGEGWEVKKSSTFGEAEVEDITAW